MSGNSRCIGGLDSNGASVRLLTSSGSYYCASAPFLIGQDWEVGYTPKLNLIPPHVEDVLVHSSRLVGNNANLRAHILNLVVPWTGGISQVFGGLIRFTGSGSGYVSKEGGVPNQSTGFWLPDCDLHLRSDGKHYDYGTSPPCRGLAYVGESPAIRLIPANTLVRVSLARWWRPDAAEPDFEERCYPPVSG